jgi:CNT family concentrative nucleoside transporter
MDFLRAVLGLAVFIGIAYLMSSDKKAINWRIVLGGMVMQFVIALAVFLWEPAGNFFNAIAEGFQALLAYTDAGTEFVLGKWPDAPVWVETGLNEEETSPFQVGFIFAFRVLPTILFFSAFSAALYYLGILQLIVRGFAWVMTRAMHLSGVESLAAAANVFIGQTEAPLVVKPYLEKMTRSEIMCLMTGGMATIAGGVFGAYMAILGGDDPERAAEFGKHLLTASVLSAPAAILIAKIISPENPDHDVDRSLEIKKAEVGTNILEAISNGTRDGLKLAVNVGAMLLTFTAFVYLVNGILFYLGGVFGLNPIIAAGGFYDGLSLQFILSRLFAPVAWLIGINPGDLGLVGQVLGEKMIINEFFAYITLGNFGSGALFQDERSIVIATYALCGFANFASIGIQIGGISAIAPGQKRNLAQLGFKAMIGGTLACLMTASVASFFV